MTVGAVVPAAGSGQRFGSGQPKLLVPIAGRTVLDWSVSALVAHPAVDTVVIVAGPSVHESACDAWAAHPKVAAIVPGGASRTRSVQAGLDALPAEVEVVIVHDAARPAVRAETISAVLAGVERWGAAVPGVPVADTVKRVSSEGLVSATVPREGLWAVQTPQGARRDLLQRAYVGGLGSVGADEDHPTDEAALLERAGIAVGVVEGDPDNIKLTTPADAARLDAILRNRMPSGGQPERKDDKAVANAPASDGPAVRTGIGYDVHRLVEGLPLWLGGVRIPHTHGLEGHSDADVIMHAVCDSLLGTIGEGDIGALFPDTDPRNRNRPSRDFVAEAARRVRLRGYEIGNVDIALQAESPRIGPYRDMMRAAVAAAAGIRTDQVGLKATTNERLGYVGRREGIGCFAVATIWRAPTHGRSGGD